MDPDPHESDADQQPCILACYLHIDGDQDPDPADHFDGDPDPTCQCDAVPQHCILAFSLLISYTEKQQYVQVKVS